VPKAVAKATDLEQSPPPEITTARALPPDPAAEQKRLIVDMKLVTEESRKARQKRKHGAQDAP
jgi:hypothetical protein